jgi:hypothetical protein
MRCHGVPIDDLDQVEALHTTIAWVDTSDPATGDEAAEARERARRLRVNDRWRALGRMLGLTEPEDFGATDSEASEAAGHAVLAAMFDDD